VHRATIGLALAAVASCLKIRCCTGLRPDYVFTVSLILLAVATLTVRVAMVPQMDARL